MAKINVVILFDGTSDADVGPITTNVVKLRNALVQNQNQMVIYCDGIGNNVQWPWYIRWFSILTGLGATWIMKEAYAQLMKKLNDGIKEKHIKQGDTLKISFGGFSRGAATARHFGNHYIIGKLKNEKLLTFPFVSNRNRNHFPFTNNGIVG